MNKKGLFIPGTGAACVAIIIGECINDEIERLLKEGEAYTNAGYFFNRMEVSCGLHNTALVDLYS